jgi:hypothetical protein
VVLIEVPAAAMPGYDLSMAFLLLDKRVVDWASCWSYNRTATQEVLLEDVDGDGSLDVAFRAKEGFWGLQDRRVRRRPGDKRAWLYAYAITAAGFESLFPVTDRDLRVSSSADATGQPVQLVVRGLSQSLREYRLCDCTISATNRSRGDLPIAWTRWLRLEAANVQVLCMDIDYGPMTRGILRPGETITQRRVLFLVGEAEQVSLQWLFVPKEDPPGPGR